MTSRWLVAVAGDVPMDIRWRIMSLSLLNEGRDEDPEGDEAGYLWIPARVCAAIQTDDHGHEALGTFYDALWIEVDGTPREWIGDIDDALRRDRDHFSGTADLDPRTDPELLPRMPVVRDPAPVSHAPAQDAGYA